MPKITPSALGMVAGIAGWALAGLFLFSCGEGPRQTSVPPASATKEKYFRGNVVAHKADGRRGVVIGKKYIQGSIGIAFW